MIKTRYRYDKILNRKGGIEDQYLVEVRSGDIIEKLDMKCFYSN